MYAGRCCFLDIWMLKLRTSGDTNFVRCTRTWNFQSPVNISIFLDWKSSSAVCTFISSDFVCRSSSFSFFFFFLYRVTWNFDEFTKRELRKYHWFSNAQFRIFGTLCRRDAVLIDSGRNFVTIFSLSRFISVALPVINLAVSGWIARDHSYRPDW